MANSTVERKSQVFTTQSFSYKNYDITTSSDPGGVNPTYYWGDKVISSDLSGKTYVACSVVNVTEGNFATAQLLWSDANKTIRARCSKKNGVVTVRVLFLNT